MDAGSTYLLARIAMIATVTFGFAAAGAAQEVPEGQSCGGLVCDLGLFGHKVPSKSAPAVSSPVPPAPAPARTAVTAEPGADVRKPVRKKAHVAKAAGTKAAGTKTAGAKVAGTQTAGAKHPGDRSIVPASAEAVETPSGTPTAVLSPAVSPAPAPVAAALAPPPSFAAPPPAPVPVTATPARDEPVVLANPYVYDKPLKFMFQSVDPTQGVQ